MKSRIRWYILSALFLIIQIMPLQLRAITPVNAQHGQNLWHIVASIGTELDQVAQSLIVNNCCATTFTALQQIDNDVLTVSSKVDALANLITADFNTTFTALNGCCTSIMSNLTGLSTIITSDFNDTFTALADIRAQEATIESKLDACCATLNSKIDGIASASTDLSPVFTALQQIDDDVLTVSSKVDACCTTINSKLDALLNITNGDFNSTFTILAAINDLITNDFNGTFTALAAGFACGATPLYQSNVVNGAIILTTSCASYCLAQCITGSIIIAASNVTVDLNAYSLLGTFSVFGSTSNVTIQNGNILPAVPVSTLDVATAGVSIAPFAYGTQIKNCRIECNGSFQTSYRDGIDNSGMNTLINNCFVQASHGSSGGSTGIGIYNAGANVLIKDSTVVQNNSNDGQFLVLVVNSGNATVQPFYAPSGTFKPSIGVSTNPYDIAITPDGKTAYVSNNSNSLLSIINIATNSVVGTVNVGMVANALAITPNGKTLYFASANTNFIGTVDIASNTLSATINIGVAPRQLAITPDGKTVYVTSYSSNVVIPVDVATNTVGTAIAGFSSPIGIAITPDGTTAYVANNGGSNTVTPINIATNTIGTPIGGFSFPQLISITPDGKTGYVSAGNTITPFTIATGSVGTPITGFLDITDSVITPDNKTLYVTDYVGNTVVPINVATNTVGVPINGFNAPVNLAVTPVIGGNAIVQNGVNGKIINTLVRNQGTAPALNGANGIQLSATAASNILKDCTINNASVGFSLANTFTVQMSGCIAQSCSSSGFDINGGTNIRLIDCSAQACSEDGFRVENNCTQCAVEQCTANNNLVNGFNFSSAGACCSVGDSFAISNNGYGYLGNATNTTFYNNFANCNGINFDSFSAASVLGGCTETTLSQFSVVDSSIILTATGASYCLSQNITGNIIISASNIMLDLNQYTVIGTIEVAGNAVNAIVHNGSVAPLGPVSSSDAAIPAIAIDPLTNYTLLEDLYIVCSNTSTPLGVNGRDGIDNFGSNTIIQRCVIQTGTGNTGDINANGGSGGTGIVSTGANAQLIDCTITTGAGGPGGASSTTTTAGAGGIGGTGITSSGANVQITNCRIWPGAGGLGGFNTNSAGAGIGGAGGAAGNGIISTSSPALINNCSIIAASGGWGGNVALASNITNITGAGGAGGSCISATGSRTIITDCYLEAGAGGRNGVMSGAGVAYPGNGGNAGAGISFTSTAAFGCAIEGCVIRLNAGGTGEATATLAPSSVVALGGTGGDGILSSANVNLISDCDIAGASGPLFNAGGNSFGFSAPGGRGGNGISLFNGGRVNVIQNCTISSMGAGGSNTSAASVSGSGSSDGGAGGNGIISAFSPIGTIRDCAILSLGNGGAGSSGGGTSTSTGGLGGSGITTSSSIGTIANCVIHNTGAGGSATGVSQGTTTIGGAGGAGIFASATAGIIENCKISMMGGGGAASNSAGANVGGVGGSGIQLTFPGNPGGTQISNSIRNCIIYFTGVGGNATAVSTGSATGGNSGVGIVTAAYSLIAECSITCGGGGGSASVSTGTSNAGSGGAGITFTGGNCTVKNCTIHLTGGSAGSGGGTGVNGDGIWVNGMSGISCTDCTVTIARGTGFNFSNAGPSCTVERCAGLQCNINGFIGSTTANNAVFYLNEASKNLTTNISGLGSNSGGVGSATGTPANAATVNYGANLTAA